MASIMRWRATALDVVLGLPRELQAVAGREISSQLPWSNSLIVRFPMARAALSTAHGYGDVRAVINHGADTQRWRDLVALQGVPDYIRSVRQVVASKLAISLDEVLALTTGVSQEHVASCTVAQDGLIVAALATAGVRVNALRAGYDKGEFLEGWLPAGTINIIVLTNRQLSPGAMAQALIVSTEAKAAVLQDLNVPSCYTQNMTATGTGTDSVAVVSGSFAPEATYAGGHSRLGELIGRAVYFAVTDALLHRPENNLQSNITV